MSEDNNKKGNVFSADDPLDINELASLNDDISPDFIEQLQNQVALNASQFTGKPLQLMKMRNFLKKFLKTPKKQHLTIVLTTIL